MTKNATSHPIPFTGGLPPVNGMVQATFTQSHDIHCSR